MAICIVRSRNELENFNVLAPERYDPRRHALAGSLGEAITTPLGSLAFIVKKMIGPASKGLTDCIVADTSDAREGILKLDKEVQTNHELGSTKKIAEPHDIIISRLRPYLRQSPLSIWKYRVGEKRCPSSVRQSFLYFGPKTFSQLHFWSHFSCRSLYKGYLPPRRRVVITLVSTRRHYSPYLYENAPRSERYFVAGCRRRCSVVSEIRKADDRSYQDRRGNHCSSHKHGR